MLKRISEVNLLKINSIATDSVFQIGDTKEIDAVSKTFAVQRADEIFFDEEGDFRNYRPFSRPIHLPSIYEPLLFVKKNINGKIHVNKLYINAMAASSVGKIGSSDLVYAENRQMHIRQY